MIAIENTAIDASHTDLEVSSKIRGVDFRRNTLKKG